MIFGIGTDIVKISRIETVLSRFGDRFLNRVFSESEQAKAKASHYPARTLASRFAAKEAAAKAIGIAVRKGVRFSDFSIHNDTNGKPILTIGGKAAAYLYPRVPAQSILRVDVSLSEESEYAVAFVVLSLTPKPTP